MNNRLLLPACIVGLTLAVQAPLAAAPTFDEVVKSVTATFDPDEAQPGETVTLKITAQIAPGWHTYPVVQPDEKAKSFTNRIQIKEGDSLTLVGELADPEKAETKSYPELGINKLSFHEGKVTWTQKVKIAANAKGTVSAEVKVSMQICGQVSPGGSEVCLPPKRITLTPTLKVK